MDQEHFTYAYDPIGNRTDAARGQEKPVEALYDRNALNQYDQVRSDEAAFSTNLTYDADGNLSGEWLDGDCNCDGQVNVGDINAFNLALSDASEYEMTYPGCTLVTADANNDGDVDVLDINPFVDLLLGGGSGGRRLVWDAENRLIGVRPAMDDEDLPDEALRSEFAYDYLNRRVMKRVYEWDTGEDEWTLVLDRRYVYDGWRVLLELDGLNSNAIIRKYTWGLDLAGLSGGGVGVPPANLDGAGGIGGLLAVYDTNGTTTGENPESDDLKYVYTYDANGNVGQLIDVAESTASASIKAHYEYDPYGGVIASSGTYADTNTYRFSTKPWDDETGLGYWGERYYDARMGRWISRDPIAEAGGVNVYEYVSNAPIARVDYHGTCPADPPHGGPLPSTPPPPLWGPIVPCPGGGKGICRRVPCPQGFDLDNICRQSCWGKGGVPGPGRFCYIRTQNVNAGLQQVEHFAIQVHCDCQSPRTDCKDLYDRYKTVCDERRSCTPNMSCSELARQVALHGQCATLRTIHLYQCVHDKKFDWQGHETEIAEAWAGATNCGTIYRNTCFVPGVPPFGF
ncbi:tRNA3(Ser)-specific nuclease WapA precursor [Phycisphaerae bacterium RAS1]|nr:tRNA3(Ser)-specific nuclease WapA precursor [Phycisphaerae bacterium RAS1]